MKPLLPAIASLLLFSACSNQTAAPIHAPGSSSGPAILGGEKVSAQDDVASVTALLVDVKQGAICTASILSDRWLLTAAHCVEGKAASDLVVGFTLDMDQLLQEGTTAERRLVSRAVAHPQFQETNKTFLAMTEKAKAEGKELSRAEVDGVKDWGDIALVELKEAIPTSYQPARLLPENAVLEKNQSVTLAGYGRVGSEPTAASGVLYRVNVQIQEPLWGSTEVLMNQTDGRGACHGDSGGPAYAVDQNGRLLLFGITSRGVGDGDVECITSAAYTNLNHYRSWIREVSGL